MKKNNKLIALFLNPKGGNIMKKNNKLIAALCAMAMAVSSFGAFSASALSDEGREILLKNMNYFANKTYTVESDTFQYLEENGRMQLATDLLDYDKGVYYMVSGLLYGSDDYADEVVNVCLTMMLSPDAKGHGERVLLYNIPEGFDFATVQIGDIYIDTDETGAVLETAPGMLSTSKMELVGNGLDLFGEDFQKVIDYEYLTDQEILYKGTERPLPAKNVSYTVIDDDNFHRLSIDELTVDANWLVSMKTLLTNADGEDSLCYTFTPINQESERSSYIVTTADDPLALNVGELLYIDQPWRIESVFPEMMPMSPLEHRGTLEDVFGSAAYRVLRETCVDIAPYFPGRSLVHQETEGMNPVFGDACTDDSLDILDVITLNQSLLGSRKLSAYSKCVSDVDKNGTIDTTDSLMILKEVVEVTKDFVEK